MGWLDGILGGGGGKGKGGSGGGNEAMPDSGLDVHNWEEAQEMSAEAREELSKQIDQAIRQGIIAVGKVTGNRDRTFDGLLEPKVDWRKVLRDFITQHCDGRDESTWRRPNRRWLQYDTYLPSMHGISTGDLVIGIDTSSSIGGEMLNKFMAEVKGICEGVQPAKLPRVRQQRLTSATCWPRQVRPRQVAPLRQATNRLTRWGAC